MSTPLNPPQKISKRHELRQDQVVTLYARAWDYADRNRGVVIGGVVALVVLALALVAYAFYRQNQAEEAERLIGGIVGLYESGQYREALDGYEGQPGLLTIADDYGSTKTGNLAHFYAANALFQLGEYDQALEHFEAYDGGDDVLGASALAGEAAVYENRGDYDEAGALYRRAALAYENDVTSPQYLLNAGRSFEAAEDYDEALEVYQLIEDRFAESPAAENVALYLARVQAKQIR